MHLKKSQQWGIYKKRNRDMEVGNIIYKKSIFEVNVKKVKYKQTK